MHKISINDFLINNENSNFFKSKECIENSDLLLKNIFKFQHAYDMEACSTPYEMKDIVWNYTPNGDPEWIYMLNRQEYFNDLITAYDTTLDDKYLLKLKDFIFDWISKNEVSINNCRTIDTGIRMMYWGISVSLLKKLRMLTDSEEYKIQQSISAQVEFLKINYISKYELSNWGVLITTGILVCGNMLDGYIKEEYMDWAINKLNQQLILQISNEGLHWEQSPLYFVEVWRNSLAAIATYKKLNKLIKESILDVLKRMHKAAWYLIKPDKHLLTQGDTDKIKVNDLYTISSIILEVSLPEDVDIHLDSLFLNIMRSGNDIDMDLINFNYIGRYMPIEYMDDYQTGNFFFKDKNKNYFHVYNGNLSSGHGHASLGHIDLSLRGEDVLIDPGRFTYVEGKERNYLKSCEAHNIIMIDNKPFTDILDSWSYSKAAIPISNEVFHNKDIEVIKSVIIDERQDEIITIIRYFLLLKNKNICLIFDYVLAKGMHTSQTFMQLNPNINISSNDDSFDLESDEFYYSIASSIKKVESSKRLYSEKYNELRMTNRIKLDSRFSDKMINYILLYQNNKSNSHVNSELDINEIKVIQSGSNSDVPREKCMAISIKGDSEETIIVLQCENTFKGQKLYIIDNISVYGELTLIHRDKEGLDYIRII